MKVAWLLIPILVFILLSCSEDEPAILPADSGYSYFPLDQGSFVIYEVDSIYHDQPVSNEPGIHDTVHFYLKELVGGEFVDAVGETGVEILRFKKPELQDDWTLSDVWFAKRSSRNAERVEENQRFVKLAFPINSFAEWNHNALNDLEPWESSYSDVGLPLIFTDTVFEKSIRVDIHTFLTEVNDELVYENYVENLGLVFRYQKLLYTRPSYLNNRVATNIISGTEYQWKMIDYGME